MQTSGNAPTLEGMPREIRDQIYGYLLPSTYHVQLEPRRAQRYQCRHRYVPSHPLPPIFPARDQQDDGIEEASSRFPPPPLYLIDPPSKTAPWAAESSHGSHRLNRHTGNPISNRLGLLSASKQMHEEASATVYAQSTFVFTIISLSRNPLPTNTLNRLRNVEFNIILLDTDYWKTAPFSIALLRLFANPDIKRDTCVLRIKQARNHLTLHPPFLDAVRNLTAFHSVTFEARFCSEFRGSEEGVEVQGG
ncbi:hypothetical protein BDR22DRAFT_433788 [Usnea florida]